MQEQYNIESEDERFNCNKVASSENIDLSTFCSTSGLWCPIRVVRVCPKRQNDRIQLTTNTMFDSAVFFEAQNKPNDVTGVVRDDKKIKIKANSRRNLRYKKG